MTDVHVWTNEPDDGHQHEFTMEPENVDVPGAVMCRHCGLLSTEDEPGDGELPPDDAGWAS